MFNFKVKPPNCFNLQRGHPLARGLIVAYTFDTSGYSSSGLLIKDKSGYNNDAVLPLADVNNFPTPASYPFGSCFGFQSAFGQQLYSPDSPSWHGAVGRSVVCVFKPGALNTGLIQILARKSVTPGEVLFRLQNNSNRILYAVYNTVPATNAVLNNTDLVVGQTYVAVGTCDLATGVRIYLDGVLDCTPAAFVGTIGSSSSYLGVGASLDDNSPPNLANSNSFFQGFIGALYIYNRALTPEEVSLVSFDPFIMCRRPRITYKAGAAPPVTNKFRRTASRIGTRTGTRQTWAA